MWKKVASSSSAYLAISLNPITQLSLRTYERIAFLASILPTVYGDEEWTEKEYLRRYKAGVLKKQCAIDALKYWNLERSLDAELQAHNIDVPLTMEDLL